MSKAAYPIIKTGTPELWVDDGYVARQSTQTSDGYTHIVCGLTQVDKVVESGTGVLTLTMSQLVNVLAVNITAVCAADGVVVATVTSVDGAGTNSNGTAATRIILQVLASGSAAALTLDQGLLISIKFTKSSLVNGKAQKAGIV